METINTDQFIQKASEDPGFLQAYFKDPERLQKRYIIEDDLMNKLTSSQELLLAVANVHPKHLSSIAKGLFDQKISTDLSDFRDGPHYQDGFNDHTPEGGFVDRYEGPRRPG